MNISGEKRLLLRGGLIFEADFGRTRVCILGTLFLSSPLKVRGLVCILGEMGMPEPCPSSRGTDSAPVRNVPSSFESGCFSYTNGLGLA